MGYNRFAGKIPGFIGDLKHLRILVLKSNFFNQSIPQDINKLEKLQIMDLPTDGDLLGYVVSSMYAGVGFNIAYKGNILLEITLFKGLAMLNLSHNALSGEIPSNIGDMIDLQSLDLSFNRLSGKIPDSVNLLDSLGYMNLSYNNFSGKIPAGTRFDILYGDGSAYIGNEQLCGAGNLINCNDKTSSSSEDTTGVEDSRDRLLFIGVVVSGYVVSFFGYFGVLCLKGEQHRKRYWKVIEKIAFKIVNFMQGKENL
ncbi:serine-threonine protein kinase, plant-type, putative [Ricinus communis]|uniref:Serine-threonine protein kinase, plant-type, putative n=1 Tax=Ricinus communis TaxID=3988 RepID=B9T688_RICCO|nr:serine-threonine protein kinase, plant-type, putative [Ricinus communis]